MSCTFKVCMLYAYLEGTTYRRYMYVSCTHTYRPRFLVFSFSLVSSHLNQNHTRIHPTKLDEIFFCFLQNIVYTHSSLILHHAFY